jgi:hypothetical protein
MGAVSQVERKLLESVRHTNAASMLASMHESTGHCAPTGTEGRQSLSGWTLPDGGNDQEISLTNDLPNGELASVRTSRISKTTSSLPRDLFYPIDCWDRFAAYPLSKDGAGRVCSFGVPVHAGRVCSFGVPVHAGTRPCGNPSAPILPPIM